MGKRISQLAEITTVDSNDLLNVVDVSDTTYSASGTNKRVTKANLLKEYDIFSGWIPAEETWTYASADAPTFTFTISGDKTSKYSVGMKIKLTQTTVKYFIVTAISYSSPNTTVTVYGGTDYTLANATITNPYYSTQKAPQGFPLSPAKWRIYKLITSAYTRNSPTSNTWYNVGGSSTQINLPIGSWDVYYKVSVVAILASSSTLTIKSTLSTANNTSALPEFECGSYNQVVNTFMADTFFARGNIAITSKATYYLNLKAIASVSISAMSNDATNTPCYITAVCAYL